MKTNKKIIITIFIVMFACIAIPLAIIYYMNNNNEDINDNKRLLKNIDEFINNKNTVKKRVELLINIQNCILKRIIKLNPEIIRVLGSILKHNDGTFDFDERNKLFMLFKKSFNPILDGIEILIHDLLDYNDVALMFFKRFLKSFKEYVFEKIEEKDYIKYIDIIFYNKYENKEELASFLNKYELIHNMIKTFYDKALDHFAQNDEFPDELKNELNDEIGKMETQYKNNMNKKIMSITKDISEKAKLNFFFAGDDKIERLIQCHFKLIPIFLKKLHNCDIDTYSKYKTEMIFKEFIYILKLYLKGIYGDFAISFLKMLANFGFFSLFTEFGNHEKLYKNIVKFLTCETYGQDKKDVEFINYIEGILVM
ncbi:hypothetical protein TCON_0324 [Astathelohania contejeani]|uniref:Uncharacterized protein n=1 Tax=Astathelohania contejeani TaxID=164912 RepID=A0ABQ7I219_9MICR|nr:hypothetical protein TCON_0324 [Thelohania contejeani]